MWDTTETSGFPRCRIWVVRPPFDTEFRRIAEEWYRQHSNGTIKSDNFQLHPPRNLDNNIFRNTCGNLQYPLLFEAHAIGGLADYEVISYNPSVLKNGLCKRA